jgi:hypothetical protein
MQILLQLLAEPGSLGMTIHQVFQETASVLSRKYVVQDRAYRCGKARESALQTNT